VTVTGGTIGSNTAFNNSGGGIFHNSGTLTLKQTNANVVVSVINNGSSRFSVGKLIGKST
jgi:hypothetical protein